MNNQKAFTLIELLVVVLIIGILAAVALPQYQKAVEKSRATQALTLLKSAYQAAEAYQLANGSWPSSFDELGIEIPWTGTVCTIAVTGIRCLSSSDWSLELWNNADVKGFSIIRLSGTYKGGGFTIRKASAATVPLDQLLCYEYKTGTYAISHAGIYCPKFFKATRLADGNNATIYTFMQ